MELFNKFKAFVNKEIKEENEPKETAVLIRFLCILDFLFLLMQLPFASFELARILALVFSIAIIIPAINFFLSYKLKMATLIYTYFFGVCAIVFTFTVLFGFWPSYHLQLIVIFMLFFYRSSEMPLVRILSVVVSCVLYVYSYMLIVSKGSVYPVDNREMLAIAILNMIWAILKAAIIGVFFRIKFSASEEKILKYSKKLEMVATTDPLTKLQNRRGMLNHINKFVSASTDRIMSVAIGDIDFFKKINDTYGHEAGDYILETLAKLMNDFMEGKGMVARWGGEEFLFVFEELNGDIAFEHLSRLLTLIEKYEFDYQGTEIKLTMTFGVEEHDMSQDIDKTVQAADEKLYMGKTNGRDRVVY